MFGRLAVNRDQVDECRNKARLIAEHIRKIAEHHTTLSVEQATLRALGAAGNSPQPIIHAIAKKLGPQSLKLGVAGWLGRIMVAHKLSPEKAAQFLAHHGLGKPDSLKDVPWSQAQRVVRESFDKWSRSLPKRSNGRMRNGQFRVAVQVETGDAQKDLAQLYSAWKESDLAVVQVPYGLSADGIASQRGGFIFKKGYPLQKQMRRAVAKNGSDEKLVCWAGAMAPETAVVAAEIPRTRMRVDPISRIHQEKMDPRKAVIEYNMILRLSARTGLRLHNNLQAWTSSAYETHFYQAIAMQIVLEQWLMYYRGEPEAQVIVLPEIASQNGVPDLVSALARNQLCREIFPQSEMWQHTDAPSAAWDSGVAAVIGQSGVMVPQTVDRKSIAALGAVFKPLAYECQFSDHGQLSRLMHTLLDRSMKELLRLYRNTWSKVVQQDHSGLFAMSKFTHGSDTVIEKDRRYWNPMEEWFGG
ncbi:MAG: hypothetical protein COV45_04625 [Deltaproteobacteria bacterium CG11_big_fil_rev_8_21_14_0_20_47_16]|nr:MAG: hypothetical protein COV45_04625 [Deltaproteobacteria bacterium CG11_big_fil_rev_8_21_14_0_20_47_16]